MMDKAPQTIGRYRVEAVIGRGAMGVIYRAHDPEIDRTVAIKLVRADLLSSDDRSDYIQRFRREAQAAGRCVHPNIVTIYDFAIHDGNPFLAMEFVDGQSLSEARASGTRFAPAAAVAIILQVLDALAVAHRLGVIHRDIKPANILLTGGRQVKVTDFGISRVVSAELTSDGLVIGTPSYMSPEQCRGLAIDPRSDIFSAGVVLYEMLSGERPFPGPNPTVVMQRLLNEEPVEISTLIPAIDPMLQSVLSRALAKSPDERYASAAEMAAALGALPASSTLAPTALDRTVIVPHRLGSAISAGHESAAPSPFDPRGGMDATGQVDVAILGTLERKLARHLGPIARVMVKNALRAGTTIEMLCDSLAANIAEPAERERFRAEALTELQRATTTQSGVARSAEPQSGPVQPAAPAAIPVAELERAEQALTRYLGPIARVLVRRKAVEAHSIPELWQLLSRHIDREDQRGEFLRRRHS